MGEKQILKYSFKNISKNYIHVLKKDTQTNYNDEICKYKHEKINSS